MSAMEPTSLLDLERLWSPCSEGAASASPQPPRGGDPGPEGPEGEPVGEEDEDGGDERNIDSKPSPGPGTPIVLEHGAPDTDPIPEDYRLALT
jgi:hypothetical protein